MKKIIALLLVLAMVLSLAACGAKAPAADAPAADAPAADAPAADAAPEKITLTVWGPQADQGENGDGWLQQTCAAFAAEHPEWEIEFKYGVCSEGDAATNVGKDPEAAADVYFFANDQIGTLLQSNALARFGGDYENAIKAANSEAMVNSVTYTDGGVYGVPFTGNTWFMYYNKSVFTEEDIKSLDTMLEKGKVGFNIGDGWYFASFYVANDGTLFGESNTDAAAGIQFGGEKGTAVTNYLVDLIANPNFVVDNNNEVALGLMKEGKCDAFFSGTWKAQAAMEALGENYAAAQLPTITIDGEAKQLRSFYGSKCIGVNPNADNMKAALSLALYLGSAEAQLTHYEMNNIITCDLGLIESNATIAADPAAVAQSNTIANTAIIQPSIPEMGNYWAPAGNMGAELINGTVTHDNAAEKTEAFYNAINGIGGL